METEKDSLPCMFLDKGKLIIILKVGCANLLSKTDYKKDRKVIVYFDREWHSVKSLWYHEKYFGHKNWGNMW